MALLADTVIVSDDAGQFNVGRAWPVLGPCRTSGSQARHLHRCATRRAAPHPRPDLAASTAISKPIAAIQPNARKAALRARFDRIFTRKTGFVTLDRLLARLHANKSELLKVLDRPRDPAAHQRFGERHPLPGHQAQDQRRNPQRRRPRLPRRLPRPPQNLRQNSASRSGIISAHGSPSRDASTFLPSPESSAPALPAALIARTFAPLTNWQRGSLLSAYSHSGLARTDDREISQEPQVHGRRPHPDYRPRRARSVDRGRT